MKPSSVGQIWINLFRLGGAVGLCGAFGLTLSKVVNDDIALLSTIALSGVILWLERLGLLNLFGGMSFAAFLIIVSSHLGFYAWHPALAGAEWLPDVATALVMSALVFALIKVFAYRRT